MKSVDTFLGRRIVAHAFSYISVQNFVSESEIILIGLTAEAVRRRLVHKLCRKSQVSAHLLNLMNGEERKRAEITYRITVSCGISYPVFRKITGVGHTTVITLTYRIHRRHTDTRRQIDARLVGVGKLLRFEFFLQAFHSTYDINLVRFNT